MLIEIHGGALIRSTQCRLIDNDRGVARGGGARDPTSPW